MTCHIISNDMLYYIVLLHYMILDLVSEIWYTFPLYIKNKQNNVS